MSNYKNSDFNKPGNNPGPISEAGRAISSRNATKHGCCANTRILPTENEVDFQSLEQTWFRSYEPKDKAEIHLVHQLIEADWFLQRATRTAAEVEAELFTASPNPLAWTEAQQKTLGRFLRYQTTRANLVTKARKAIEDYRKNRTAEANQEQARATVEVKLQILKEKAKPKLTWQQELAILKQEAESRESQGPSPKDPTL